MNPPEVIKKPSLCALMTSSFLMLSVAQAQPAAQAINEFGFDLYRECAKPKGNLLFSPFSVATALAMTSAGTEQGTLAQMISTLHLSPNYHPEFKDLLGQLKGNTHYQLLVANRLWGQSGVAFYPAFLTLLHDNYSADIEPLDFRTKIEDSRKSINDWVQRQTQDKIMNLLKPGTISKDTDLVLTNALYFKGTWQRPFDNSDSYDERFQTSSTESKTIAFMHKTADFRYSENPQFQYLQLPYKGGGLAMEIFLPRPKLQLSGLNLTMNAQSLTDLAQKSHSIEVKLSLPRFKAESELNLGDSLSKLGMPLAFSKAKVNFHGIRKVGLNDNLFISKVLHRALVDINEEGTEAAAATAIVAKGTGGPPPTLTIFKADRPFLFFIRHLSSGTILFMGRFSQP